MKKYAKAAAATTLIASLIVLPSSVSASDKQAPAAEGEVQANLVTEGNDTAGQNVARQIFWTPSPAGCKGSANHAHASHQFQGEIGYQATVICRYDVEKISIEVWGDRRHGWGDFSVWRQHTDRHKKLSSHEDSEFRVSQHKTGDWGSHHYRTRAKVYTVENGVKYEANLHGWAIEIRCGSHPSGYKCWD